MGESNPTNPAAPSTTAADLVTAIDATLLRCFGPRPGGGLDETAEARRLGLPDGAILALRERLEDLRRLAARAADAGAPPKDTAGPR